MKRLLSLYALSIVPLLTPAQTDDELPHYLTRDEVRNAQYSLDTERGITTPPPYSNLRTMAEWEELQALVITWTSYQSILKKIVAAAKVECQVIIITSNIATTQSYLTANNAGGPPLTLDNISFINTSFNSVWQRDYGPTTVYGSEVDDPFLVDWIYNRPRPLDDVTPDAVGSLLGLPVYSTTTAPYNLMNTGGNFMSDGFGTAFASELIIQENSGGSAGWTTYPNHTVQEIDDIMNQFMGIDTYIKMPVLPYDGIHHIDMHMKLLDEETILVSKYPTGVADGPQIEANINYVLNNFTTKWGTPFKVIEIPAPPQQSNGNYPNNGGWYLTYANSVFVNKTVILPTYYTQYDTTAIRIYQEALPGYTIVPIDCDNTGANIISAGGAIHCITHEIGVNDPLLISFNPLETTNDVVNPYPVVAYINHKSGIASASLYYKTAPDNAYTAVAMSYTGNNEWTGSIPPQPYGTTVYYYVEATANSGKVQRRPMTAPAGYKSFKVVDAVVGCTNPQACNYNPAATIENYTCQLGGGCTDPMACNYDPAATCDNGTCAGTITTYYQDADKDGYGNAAVAISHCNAPCNGSYTIFINSNNYWMDEVSWNLKDATNTTIASGGPYGNGGTVSVNVSSNNGPFTFFIETQGPYNDNYPSWSITSGGGLLLASGNTTGGNTYTITGIDCSYVTNNNDCNDNNPLITSLPEDPCNGLDDDCDGLIDEGRVDGCTDYTACNYNALATCNTVVCIYPGCTDNLANNYNPAAGCDDGSCTYNVPGCTDIMACNYNPLANINDGSCTYPGCTNAQAPNYNPAAGCDDGSCISTCAGDYDNNGIINTSDLLLFMGGFGCAANCGIYDFDNNGVVNTSDLLLFMGQFGVVCG